MILTAHQPVYLPWLGLFHKISLADLFIYFDQVQYQPKDWNNRNKIKVNNGELLLSVPVKTKGHRQKNISEIEINNDIPWQRKHWKSIKFAYEKSPYFSTFACFFDELYNSRVWTNLTELNLHMLRWFLMVLGIDVELRLARDYNFTGYKSELVRDMCLKLGANMYIFGALGKDYSDIESFTKSGISLLFQDYIHPVYPQQYGDFIPNLSIIDLLFNCGPNSLKILQNNNATKNDIVT